MILNKRLADHQREALRACGFDDPVTVGSEAEIPPDAFPCLVAGGELFFTTSLLRAFQAVGRGNARLAIPECRWLKDALPAQDLDEVAISGKPAHAFPMWWLESKSALADAAPVAIDPNEEVREIKDVPKVFTGNRQLAFALTARVAMRIRHWVHILRTNHLAMAAIIGEVRERPKWRNALALAWLLARSFPPNEARVMRRLVRKGKRVKIHPSAVVEASVLGDGVQIGAQAVVRASVLGDGAQVKEGSLVEMTVVGPGAMVTKDCCCNFNVLYPGAVLGWGLHQISLIGREAFVAAHAALYDFRDDGNIEILHRGKVVDSGSNFLGVCVGHGAFVGADVFVAHGRSVPNGVKLVKDPQDVLRKIEVGAPGVPLVVHDGVARPLESFVPRTPAQKKP